MNAQIAPITVASPMVFVLTHMAIMNAIALAATD